MSEDLRARLGESKVEGRDARQSPWPPEVWQAAFEAYKSGYVEREKRFPIIIDADSPFSTPERLVELAELPSVPRLTATYKTRFTREQDDANGPRQKYEEVKICDVSQAQIDKVKSCTEGGDVLVWFEKVKRFAWMASTVKATTSTS